MFPRRIEILEIKKEGYKYTDQTQSFAGAYLPFLCKVFIMI